MFEMISYCGLDCSACPSYIATQNDDLEALAKVAAEWSEQFGFDIKAEQIMCDGCKSVSGRLSGYCKMCEVHTCASARGVVTCAHCDDYGCEKLQKCPAYEAKGKPTLDRINSEL
jgi:hypothetical protein